MSTENEPRVDRPGNPCWHCGATDHDTAGHVHRRVLSADQENALHQEYEAWWKNKEPDDPLLTFSGWLRQYKNIDGLRDISHHE